MMRKCCPHLIITPRLGVVSIHPIERYQAFQNLSYIKMPITIKTLKEYWNLINTYNQVKKINRKLDDIRQDCCLRGKPLPENYHLLLCYKDQLINGVFD
jgi:hypothetical protein